MNKHLSFFVILTGAGQTTTRETISCDPRALAEIYTSTVNQDIFCSSPIFSRKQYIRGRGDLFITFSSSAALHFKIVSSMAFRVKSLPIPDLDY